MAVIRNLVRETTPSSSETTVVSPGGVIQEDAILWRIGNFSVVTKHEDWINSQFFEFEINGRKNFRLKSKWRVCLVAADYGASGKWIKIRCALIDHSKAHEVLGDCTITFRNRGSFNGGNDVKLAREINLSDFPFGGFAFNVINRSNAGFFVDEEGYLNIKFQFRLYSLANGSNKCSLSEFQRVAQEKANKDLELLELLRGDVPLTEIKIITGDKKEFTAHWGVLAARCAFFQTMYQSNLKERKLGVLELPDISAKAFEVFRHFIYSGALLPSWKDEDVVVELTNAAAKYEQSDLLSYLDGALGSVCTGQTAMRLLSLAHKLGLKEAEVEVFSWVKENGVVSAEGLIEMVETMGIGDD